MADTHHSTRSFDFVQDRRQHQRINLSDSIAVDHWCDLFGCSPADLRQAVHKAGTSPAAVQAYLADRFGL
jgi:hypothetical protein